MKSNFIELNAKLKFFYPLAEPTYGEKEVFSALNSMTSVLLLLSCTSSGSGHTRSPISAYTRYHPRHHQQNFLYLTTPYILLVESGREQR